MTTPEDCAVDLLQTIPLVMRVIRTQMRGCRAPDLSVPQIRTMIFIGHEPGTGISEAAEFIGLSLPAMSKLVEGLVRRGLVSRESNSLDRRRVILNLSLRGKKELGQARRLAHAAMSSRLAQADPEELEKIFGALKCLRSIFSTDNGKGEA